MNYKEAANSLVEALTDIGDALRMLNGSTKKYSIHEVADAIRELQLSGLNVFEFTGSVQEWTVPLNGIYELECRGAGAGDGVGGKGSKCTAQVQLYKGDILYIYVGGKYNTFNGGGNASSASGNGANAWSSVGSGATDIRFVPSSDDNGWSGIESLASRIITAGGGGAKGTGNSAGQEAYGWWDEYGYRRTGKREVNTSTRNFLSVNTEASNNVLGKGSDSATSVYRNETTAHSDTYGDETAVSWEPGIALAGGGGYYGGTNGHTGTSYVVDSITHNEKAYVTSEIKYEQCVNDGDGFVRIKYVAQPS